MMLSLVLALPAWASSSVARVALLVGEVHRVAASGGTQRLSLGAELRESDGIVTGPDGMVMLVFADQARLSVRPNTELVIRRYQLDPSGVDTRIQIELVRGVVRQISGAAAHIQPDRYRLNTPIAVIGVRGTDFIAKTDGSTLQAYVHEGGIVVLPPAQDTGVPGGLGAERYWAVLHSGDAAAYAVVRAGGSVERRHLGAEDLEAIFGIRLAAAQAGSAVREAGRGESVAAAPSARGAGHAASSLPAGEGLAVALQEEIVEQWPVRIGRPAPGVEQAPPASVETQPPPVALPQQLVWGRFSSASDLPWQLSVPYAQASQGRHPTVGQLGEFALWRAGVNNGLDRNLRGQATFALAAADALLIADGVQPQRAAVSAPQLAVDFDKQRFHTELTLRASTAAPQVLRAEGRLNDDGILLSVQTGQRVAGALSADGREAGYFFNLQAREGLYQGMTLWTAR